MSLTIRTEATRCAVRSCLTRRKRHAVERRGDVLAHLPAMLRMTASASSGRAAAMQWEVMLKVLHEGCSSCWRVRIVTCGEFHAAARSSARPARSGAGAGSAPDRLQ